MNAPTAPAALAQFTHLRVDELVPSQTRVQALRRARFTDTELQELAASLRAQGMLQPIVARPRRDLGDFHAEVVAGERRLLAALHNAAPELFSAARRLEALEEAMRRFPINWIRNEINDLADQILKERSK